MNFYSFNNNSIFSKNELKSWEKMSKFSFKILIICSFLSFTIYLFANLIYLSYWKFILKSFHWKVRMIFLKIVEILSYYSYDSLVFMFEEIIMWNFLTFNLSLKWSFVEHLYSCYFPFLRCRQKEFQQISSYSSNRAIFKDLLVL